LNRPASNPPAPGHDEGTIPLPHPLKQKIKDAIVAVSLANLCFVSAWFGPLYDEDLGFFNRLPVIPPTLLALTTNILWFALVVWLVMQARRRFQNRALHLLIHLVFLFLLLMVVDRIRAQFHPKFNFEQLVRQPAGALAAIVIGVLVLWKHRAVARISALIVAILSPMAVFNFVRIALLCLGIMHLRQAGGDPALPPLGPVRENQPRVVWIIFDELDYRLVFEQPPAGFQFPEFDRLRNESLFATKAFAPTDGTILSMPSMIVGRQVRMTALTNSSDLALTFADTGETAEWSQLPSVFSSARQLGVNTALVGWYIPYGRVLHRDLNYCSWYPYPAFEPSRSTTFGKSMLRQIECLSGPLHIRQGFVDMYHKSMNDSLFLVTNASYGLILLHLYPPHGPGLYLPDEDRFTLVSQPVVHAYLNNLVLADRSLGKLRRAMEQSGQWDKTWVILSADHSWRSSQLYDGRRDYRVPFLVKPAGPNEPMTYAQQFNNTLTRGLILAILQGGVTNQPSVAVWLDANGKPLLPIKGTFRE